jgi:hypothetical protein
MKICRNNHLTILLFLFSVFAIVSSSCGTTASITSISTPTVLNQNLLETYVKQTVDVILSTQTDSPFTLTPAPTTTHTPAPTNTPAPHTYPYAHLSRCTDTQSSNRLYLWDVNLSL